MCAAVDVSCWCVLLLMCGAELLHADHVLVEGKKELSETVAHLYFNMWILLLGWCKTLSYQFTFHDAQHQFGKQLLSLRARILEGFLYGDNKLFTQAFGQSPTGREKHCPSGRKQTVVMSTPVNSYWIQHAEVMVMSTSVISYWIQHAEVMVMSAPVNSYWIQHEYPWSCQHMCYGHHLCLTI